MIRDVTMIKFDLRTLMEMVTKMSLNWPTADINAETTTANRKDEQPEQIILPAFPLKNWQNFCDMENLLETNDVASRQLVSFYFFND